MVPAEGTLAGDSATRPSASFISATPQLFRTLDLPIIHGRGFDAQAPVPAGHFGLVGMRERAAAIGARLSVSSLPNRGTEVSVVLPLEAPALRQVG